MDKILRKLEEKVIHDFMIDIFTMEVEKPLLRKAIAEKWVTFGFNDRARHSDDRVGC